jgi:hypothetical protein
MPGPAGIRINLHHDFIKLNEGNNSVSYVRNHLLLIWVMDFHFLASFYTVG